MKEIVIDKNKCIGCFKCKKVCYTSFEVGFDGKARVRDGISKGDVEDAKRAVICCPTGAISIKGRSSKTSLLDLFLGK